MNAKTVKLCLTAVIVAMAAEGWATVDYGPKYLSPTEEVVTPHIKWAKPDAQGPLRVLFIVGRSTMREVVELAQRTEMQYTVFAVGTATGGHNFSPPCTSIYTPDIVRDLEVLTKDLDNKLDGSYDLIVLGSVGWSSLPLILRYKILNKVKEGTPLIGFVLNPDEYFKRAIAKKEKPDLPVLVPYKGLPAFSGHKDTAAWLDATVDYAVFGKGKIISLKGYEVPKFPNLLQALTPGPEGDIILDPKLVEYDYYLAWIIHLMRFMIGRTTVRVVGSDYVTAERGELKAMEYLVSGPADKAVTCAFTFRNDDNQVVGSQEKEIRLSSGGETVRFDVPSAPAGRYFADVWVKEGEKVWAFGSSFIELSGDPVIEGIEIRKDYRWEEKVSGKIKVVAKNAAEGIVLVLRQRDTYGRITAQARVNVPAFQTNTAQEVSFELAGGKPLTIIQYLDAELRKGDEVLHRKTRIFSISDLPAKDDIRYIGWSRGIRSYPSYYVFAELAKAGFDTFTAPGVDPFTEIPFLSNLRFMIRYGSLQDIKTWANRAKLAPEIPERTKDDHVRLPCLTDPQYRDELASGLTKCVERHKLFSMTDFSMGDEGCFINYDYQDKGYELCFSPSCVATFHKFLASEYQTVEAMNREYEAQYKSFDDVQPVTLEEVKKGNMPRPLWVDYRRHMESTWAGIYQYCADVVHKVAPEVKFGYDGSDNQINSFGAADFYKLMKVMRVNGPYYGEFVPYAVMSFAEPGTLLGLGWYGGYNFGPLSGRKWQISRYIAWRHLFLGANSFWVFTTDPCNIETVLAPDLSFYDFFKANVAEVKEIKRGIGKLLMTTRRADDGIAILYSASSVHVSTLTEGLSAMEKVLNALPPLFEDTCYQFRIISYEQVANGELKRGKYRVLWLPYSQALSRKEAVEIEAFVREGGTVIADIRPGVCDEHGKPYEEGGVLDNVFGVKQRTKEPMAANCDVKDVERWMIISKGVACDLSLKVGTGKAKALLGHEPTFDHPALIINSYGKGKAILLNFSLSAYARIKNSAVKVADKSHDIRELFKMLMVQAGVEEAVKVESEISLRLYRSGRDDNGYVGVLQELPESISTGTYEIDMSAKPAVLKLSGKRHIYDVCLGKYLGYTDRINVSVEPAKGQLFALLPYKVKGVKVDVAGQIGQGMVFEYKTAVQGVVRPGLHVFHVELISPKGEAVSYYADNVVGENGEGKGSFSLALNEAVGKWKIRARDVATGLTVEQVFSVEERNQ